MGSGEENLIGKLAGNTSPVDPALLARPEVRAALASHDIGTLFRILNTHGWSQRGIAGATKMHQSEVSEIIHKGRQGQPVRHLQPRPEPLGPAPAPAPLPSRIHGVHVAKVRELARWIDECGRTYGADPGGNSGPVAWATRLLEVPGAEPVKQALLGAVTELQLEAGWDAFGAGLHGLAMDHFLCGLELGTQTGDT